MTTEVGEAARAPLRCWKRYRLDVYPSAIAVLLLVLALTALATFAARDAERERISTLLERRAEAQVQAIRFGVRDRIASLSAVRGLYAGSDEVTAENFDAFLQHAPLAWGEIEAVAWATSANERLQIEFCRPAETCRETAWSDLIARTRPAFETVRWTNSMMAAGPLTLLGGGAPRYLAISDVSDLRPASASRLRGYVVAIVSIDRLLEAIINEATAPSGMEIYVYDTDEAGRRLVHFHSSRLRESPIAPRSETDVRSGLHFEGSIAFAGRELGVVLAPIEAAVAELRAGLPLATAALGLLASVAAAGYAASGAQRQEKLRRAADHAKSDLGQAQVTLNRQDEELTAANELLHGIVEASPAVILALDCDGKVILWNPAAERVFGYSREEAIGSFHPIVPADQRTSFEAVMCRVMAGEALREVDVIRQRKSGERVLLRASGGPLHDRNRRLIGAVFVVEDVTEKRSIQQQLAQAQKMEAVGQLTGGIAHDFNNLLQVILGSADLLCAQLPEGDECREMAELARTAAERGAALTGQLLAFSRKQALDPQIVDVNGVVRGLEPLLRRTLGDWVVLATSLSADSGLAFIDRGQLESALLNLAVNARDAMPSGGRLIIETADVELDSDYARQRTEVTEGAYVMLAVSDTGIGMAPDTVKRVFEPFFTTKPAGKGTGLGLSMVFGFVKQSKGHVSVYSEVGHGTTMRLYLPRAGTAERERAPAQPEEMPRPVDPDLTILYVEDDPDVRKFGLGQLSSLGYRALEAANPEQALAVLAGSARVDLLFTDVVLGGAMNGYELSQRAAELRPGLKVLFASGYNEAVVMQNGLLRPGVALLRKPYRRADVASRIATILNDAI